MSMIALDIETTGLDLKRDAITEVAAIRFEGDQILDRYQQLINPRKPIPSNITQLTHITDSMVLHAPTFPEVVGDIAEFVGDDVIVGHNVNFDLSFLRQGGILRRSSYVDTYELAAVLVPRAPRYKLAALAQSLGVECSFKEAHRALYDTEMTFRLFNVLKKRAYEIPLELLSTLVSISGGAQWSAQAFFRDVLMDRVKHGETKRPGGNSVTIPVFDQSFVIEENEMRPVDVDQPLDVDEIASVLDEGGAFSRYSSRFEPRSQQLEMLRRVAQSFNDGNHMLIEAGTGTGKSFAYLIPAYFWAKQNGERVIISTNTINLQEQLIQKDIPELEAALGEEIRATVQKGRGNYLCPKRLMTLQARGAQSPDEMRVMGKILVWLDEKGNGDRTQINLNGPMEAEVWGRLSAENEGCRPNSCPFRRKGQCPFYAVRAQAQHSHIVIVNHALLLADAVYAKGVLPEYKYLVIDEGHHLEEAATGALSFKTSQFEINRAVQELGSANSGSLGRVFTAVQPRISSESYDALLADASELAEYSESIEDQLRQLFADISRFLEEIRDGKPLTVYGHQQRLTDSERSTGGWSEIENDWFLTDENLSKVLDVSGNILKTLEDLTSEQDSSDEELEAVGQFSGNFDSLSVLRENLEALFLSPQSGYVYWVDQAGNNSRISLCSAPLNVGPMIEENLWHEKECVILTSATLSTDRSFEYMRGRLCADEADDMSVGSPFDYEKSVMLFLPTDAPEPNMMSAQHVLEISLINLCKAVGGKTLVLFTSYAQLKRTSNAIAPQLTACGINIFEQGEGVSASALLETFRKTEKGVLMGTRSFWEGVDIQGEALSVVVIVKLPFDVPTDPVVAARADSFDEPFSQYTIPEAILKFRQGFGRLIRSKTDRGVVVIMDPRIRTKRYGVEFIRSIPKCTMRQTTIRDLPQLAKEWLKQK